jgi:hypothetical protein
MAGLLSIKPILTIQNRHWNSLNAFAAEDSGSKH